MKAGSDKAFMMAALIEKFETKAYEIG